MAYTTVRTASSRSRWRTMVTSAVCFVLYALIVGYGAAPIASSVVQARVPVRQSAPTPGLDPSAIARAYLEQGVAASKDRPSAAARWRDDIRPGATSESVALSLQPAVSKSDDSPSLAKQHDGSWKFSGRGFDATIQPDGSVLMSDKYGGLIVPLVPKYLPDGHWAFFSLGGAWANLDALMQHTFGRDPYKLERRWFLQKTQALRERLAARAEDRSIRVQLLTIWSAEGSTFSERRLRTFALWDGCANDARGQHGRELIEDFVREKYPQEGARGFAPEELDRLNAQRHSRPEFAPYAVHAALH